ncbi:MAG: GntR family transcriptional regulator, partial [Candidatus Phosphoribacter sp.]
AIEDSALQPGDPFENELALADRLDLSRPTVRRAIAELVARGLLVRRRGVGTVVASEVIHRRDELTSLYEELERKGRKPSTRVLTIDRQAVDPHAAAALGVPPDTPLFFVQRLRLAGSTPIALMHNWLPPQFNDISTEQLTKGSLYAVLRARGIRPVVAHQSIGARRPRGAERKRLGLSPRDPLLTMTRRTYGASGVALEFGDHCYRFDHYAFDVTVHER